VSEYQQALELLKQASNAIPFRYLKRELAAIAHKLRYPLFDILEKIPGDSLRERAEAVGVSRQTMYVWGQEKFRPSAEQAALISKLTGVPEAHIRADGYREGKNDVGGTAVKAAAKLASGGKTTSGSDGRTGRGSGRGRVDAPQKRSRSVRTVHKRTRG
jgi:DNA-binding XRE family transcriptional regulator